MKIISTLTLLLLVAGGASAQRGRGPGASPRAMPSSSAPASSDRATRTGTSTAAGRVQSHPDVASRIQPLLPPGTTAESAASGFRNQGRFLAALHVSHNLNIPFEQIKAKMTGPNPVSLGDAIHSLRPEMDKASVKKQVKAADRQSRDDLRPETGS